MIRVELAEPAHHVKALVDDRSRILIQGLLQLQHWNQLLMQQY